MGASSGGMGGSPTSTATTGGGSQGGYGQSMDGGYGSQFGFGYGGGYGGGYTPFRGGFGYGAPFPSQAQQFNYGLPNGQPLQNLGGQQLQNALVNAGPPIQQQIATGYQQIFGRAPDVGGVDFWTNHFQGRGLTQQEINNTLAANAGGSDINAARDYTLSQMRGVRPSSTERQFYQPVYQSQYTNYSRSPFMYSPSYSSGTMGNPFAYGGGYGKPMGGYGGYPMYYAEGGIASLDKGE